MDPSSAAFTASDDAVRPAPVDPLADVDHGDDPLEVDALQRRLIGRLAIACKGLDPRLDRELGELSVSVRGQCDAHHLRLLLGRLSQAIALLPDPAAPGAGSQTDENRSLLRALLKQLSFQSELMPRATTLAQAIDSDPEMRGDAIAYQLAKLIADDRASLRAETREAQRLLAQVTVQLESLARDVAVETKDRQAAARNNASLNTRITHEMQAIDSSIRSASSLDALKTQVSSRLEQIGAHLHTHREREEQRVREYEQHAAQMRARIAELEQTATSLRQSAELGHQLALTDALTGIPNRMAYENRMRQICENAEHRNRPMTLAIWDVDHFKRINDNYGHPVGDKLLRIIAQLLSRQVRAHDLVARYGGEEFVMLFCDMNAVGARTRANRIRELVTELDLRARGEPVAVTISCGLTQLREDDDPESALDRADQALYRAKQSGRNRCVGM